MKEIELDLDQFMQKEKYTQEETDLSIFIEKGKKEKISLNAPHQTQNIPFEIPASEIKVKEKPIQKVIPQNDDEYKDVFSGYKPNQVDIKEEPVTKQEPVKEVIKKEKNVLVKKEKKSYKKVLITMLVIVLLGAGAYFGINLYNKIKLAPNLEFTLKQSSLTIEYGTPVDLRSYIVEDNLRNNVDIIGFDENTLGKQIIVYQMSNGFKSIKKQFELNVIDTTPPEFELTSDSITIAQKDVKDFDCTSYVNYDSFKDNYDGFNEMHFVSVCPDLSDISPSSDGVIIKYRLQDSSGNESSKTLKVLIDKED